MAKSSISAPTVRDRRKSGADKFRHLTRSLSGPQVQYRFTVIRCVDQLAEPHIELLIDSIFSSSAIRDRFRYASVHGSFHFHYPLLGSGGGLIVSCTRQLV